MSDRSSEAGGAAAATPPPPAPPLPPPPSSSARLAANVIARFAQNINYGARVLTTPDNDVQGSPTPGLSLPRSSRLEHEVSSSSSDLREIVPFDYTWKSPLVPPGVDRTIADRTRSSVSSKTTSHRTGIQILSLDISPCRTRAVLAGRDILKTVAIDGSKCNEDFNIREKIRRYAATQEPAAGGLSARQKDQLAVNDVKWSNGDFHTAIATAVRNGQIVLYDLNRAGVELARLHEHTRRVHRLGFNPHRGNLLLSGSQDGTTRLWDLRALAGERSVMTCNSKSRYTGNSEGIRDVRWSPTNGVEFAIGTDSGVIQRWDIRKETSPSLKVNAHEKNCNAVDWHPDGKHLVSGSADRTAKVWDFSSSDRRMKPSWQIRGPQAVWNVHWRPASWFTEDQRPGSWHCTQLAASYDEEEPQIHIWDLRRPSLPSQVLKRDAPPTAILWHSEDLLWSVDLAGTFTQTDIKFAPQPMAGYNLNPVGVSPDGSVLFASVKRDTRRLSIEDVTDNLLRIERREASRSGRNSAAHSSTPGSHEEPSLLGSTFKNRRSKAPNSLKSARSTDSTPPSAGSDDAVLPLEQSLQQKFVFKNPQALGVGQVPGLTDSEAFMFMARHYLPPPALYASNRNFNVHLILCKTFLHNANVAAFAGKHRLAQTWRILAQAVERELGQRAERSYQSRRRASIKQANDEWTRNTFRAATTNDGSLFPYSPTRPFTPKQESGERDESTGVNTSIEHHASPISLGSGKGKETDRTAMDTVASPGMSGADQTMEEFESFQTTSRGLASKDGSGLADKHQTDSGLDELDRQIAERRAAMGSYRAQPRSVLKLDDPFRPAESGEKTLEASKEDSNEVFRLFSAPAESPHQAILNIGSSRGNKLPEPISPITDEDVDDETLRKALERGQAESAMEFDDDEEMVGSQRSPGSPKRKSRTLSAAEASMTSHEAVERERPALNSDDIIPFKYVKPPPDPKRSRLDTGEHFYIESDFYDKTEPIENVPFPSFPPWTATSMFLPLIEFHCRSLHDSQLPAYLILHLAPWLYVDMPRFRALRILATYHDRLTELELYEQATELRIYCEEYFREIAYPRGEVITTGGPWCTNCKKPSKGRQRYYCERCRKKWEYCAVCHGYDAMQKDRSDEKATVKRPLATIQEAGDVEWGWCSRCGHGGHIGCLRTFWDYTEEGSCPSTSCSCDCVPGKARKRVLETIMEEARSRSTPVTKDSWKVKESSAVQRTRSMVGGTAEVGRSILQGGRGAGRGDGGSGPSTLGSTGRSGSGGKKSVMFNIPDDKDEDGKNGKEYRKTRNGRSGSSSS